MQEQEHTATAVDNLEVSGKEEAMLKTSQKK